jgi:hypothetical protein
VRVLAVDNRRLKLRVDGLFVFFDKEPLRPCGLDLAPQLLNLLLHLGMLTALANPFKVRLNLAFQLEAVAPRAALKGVLHDVAAELQWACQQRTGQVVGLEGRGDDSINLWLPAFGAGTLDAGKPTPFGLGGGVIVVVLVVIVLMVVVEDAAGTAVHDAALALRAAVGAVGPHASGELGALHLAAVAGADADGVRGPDRRRTELTGAVGSDGV